MAGVNSGMRIPTTADLMSMWNASGLKEKLIFTFAMLVAFRFGIHLPVFGINNQIFSTYLYSLSENLITLEYSFP